MRSAQIQRTTMNPRSRRASSRIFPEEGICAAVPGVLDAPVELADDALGTPQEVDPPRGAVRSDDLDLEFGPGQPESNERNPGEGLARGLGAVISKCQHPTGGSDPGPTGLCVQSLCPCSVGPVYRCDHHSKVATTNV